MGEELVASGCAVAGAGVPTLARLVKAVVAFDDGTKRFGALFAETIDVWMKVAATAPQRLIETRHERGPHRCNGAGTGGRKDLPVD